MIEYITPRVFLFSTQVLVFSSLLFIFFIYYQTFSRQYVKYWLVSFSALTLSYLIKAFAIYPSTKLSVETWYIAAEFCLHFSQYLFVAFLIFGVLHAKNKVVKRKLKWASALLILALSLLSTLLFSFDSKQAFNHFYLSVSLPSFISGCALLALSSFLLIDKGRYFSSRMLMFFSAVFGFRFLIHSFVSIVALVNSISGSMPLA